MKNIAIRYIVATVGLFAVALGTALSAIANLGIAPLSALGYVFNQEFSTISFGTFIFLVNLLYLLFQILFYGKAFKAKYLLQLVASLIFSVLVDVSMWMCSWIVTESLVLRLLLIVIASIVIAIGVSIELASNAWMLSAEMTVASVCYRFPQMKFGSVKIVMDFILVAISAILCYLFFGNVFGSGEFSTIADQLLARTPGTVVGLGTIILAFLPGFLIKYTNKIIK